MQFISPAFLLAALAIAVPIIIHLFYFRRFKKVYFTNVRFLKEVKEETSSRRKLRNLLVLAMRCLALLAMVLAFAQPFLPKANNIKQGQKDVSIYIDNSFTMASKSKDAPLLELAKVRAKEIVAAYAPDDRIQVLTNDFEGKHQRLVSKDDAVTFIEEIRISPASKDLSKVLARQKQCLNTGSADHEVAYLISDFQKNVSDFQHFKDTLLEVNLVQMRAVEERNISIDSMWMESPVQVLNQPSTALVKITNRGDQAANEVRLSLRHDNQTKPVGEVSVPARSTVIDTVSFNILHGGWHEAVLSITDFPVQFDDEYYFTFHVPQQINVLSINGLQPNKYISKAFAGAPFFKLDQADARSIDYSALPKYQLIILNELRDISSGISSELKAFTDNGGNVMVFPAMNAELNSYGAFMGNFQAGTLGGFEKETRQAVQINTEDFVFKDVFLNKNANLRLPTSLGNYRLSAGRGEPILTYRDGNAMVNKFPQLSGNLYFSAAPLDEQVSDLVKNGEIFVPMLFRMALSGRKDDKIAHIVGQDEVLEAKHNVSGAANEITYKLQGQSTGEKNAATPQMMQEFIPEQRILGNKVVLSPGSTIRDAGWYRLRLQSDSTLSQYAYNYDRKESDIAYSTEEELRSNLSPNMKLLSATAEANFGEIVGENNQGVVLWRWCIIFALLFLALEVLFLRLWKV